mmetsp:Transcript_21404/g.61671  ORF Transcript_21404/g.61671 Transcript_21404/m.61671 type:complete len:279 (+) Transcript_21404:85-921(+)
MKWQPSVVRQRQEKRRWRCCRCLGRCRVDSCAQFKVLVTFLMISTCFAGLLCSFVLQEHMERLSANYDDQPTNEDLPCARRVLPFCSSATMDTCDSRCCPAGYMCIRDPTTGIYCQNRDWSCGRYDFCIGIADLPGTCEKGTCQLRTMVERMAFVISIMTAIAAGFDLLDLVLCMACKNNVLFKSVSNLLSFLVKMLAFSCVLGVGTDGYLVDLIASSCFNMNGQVTAQQAQQVFRGGTAALFFSCVFSFCLIPISALHGGRMKEGPEYRLKALEIGA